MLALGTRSFMRLKQRSTVDFPQPDGPIMAVTWLARMVILTPPTAWNFPYRIPRSLVSTLISPCSACSSPTVWKTDGTGAFTFSEEGRGDIWVESIKLTFHF